MKSELFADAATIAAAVARVAEEIDRAVAGEPEAPILVGVLKGSLPFLADLARACKSQVEIDLLAISQFGVEAKQGGVVRILKDLDSDIQGRAVILIEDIVDTGLTLGYLMRMLNARGPSSLKVATLLDRRTLRTGGMAPDYAGLDAPQGFLVGYGLDHEGVFRNLRNLWLLDETPDEMSQTEIDDLYRQDAAL